MQELFQMDLKDYEEDGKAFVRPSVRAIVIQDDKVLLMHSRKYNYLKFPGGGIEKGEDHTAALCREVREESGYVVLPETIKEFGSVMRKQRDSLDPLGIFIQENFYYTCEVAEETTETEQDAYEQEAGFEPVWVNPFMASRHNLYQCQGDFDPGMVERERKVLELVDTMLRRTKRQEHERTTIASLGALDYAGMLSFVQNKLREGMTEDIGAKITIAYDRYEHTKRVLSFAKRLYDRTEDKEALRYEDILIATIFHDVGRNLSADVQNHAKAGMPITEAYLREHGFDEERTAYIVSLVGAHSEKYRMHDPDIDPNLLLLMEADNLDDCGALGIVMDAMITQARNREADFHDCLDHISRFTHRIMHECQVVTKVAVEMWEEKRRLVDNFVAMLEKDIVL